MEEEGKGGVQHDVAVEIFMGLVQHSTIVAGVDVVAPAVLGWIDVKLGHSHHAHLLVVPVAFHPSDPVAAGDAAQPHNGGAQPQVHWTTLVRGHHSLLHTAIDHGVGLGSVAPRSSAPLRQRVGGSPAASSAATRRLTGPCFAVFQTAG